MSPGAMDNKAKKVGPEVENQENQRWLPALVSGPF
jgi:hypothetical protein